MVRPRHQELTEEIRRSPTGPGVAAFFDFDRTLVAGFSATAFARDWLASGRAGPLELAEASAAVLEFQLGRIGFSSFLTRSMVMLRGMSEQEFQRTAARIAEQSLKSDIYPEMRAVVEAHRERGHTLAIVSSAMRYQIADTAEALGIEHILCTEVEVRDGHFTGRLLRPTCYGEGKALYARRFAAPRDIDLASSFFYTDSDEDLPLLEAVGRPRPVNANQRLAAIAASRGWPARRFASRGTPGIFDIIRTGMSLGAIFPSLALGLPTALLDGNMREAVNVTASTWGEVGLALAGVRLRVEGEANLWSQRPAVFLFNHQSALDAMLVCKLLRRDFAGIGKKEIRDYPLLGQAFALAGTIFIDRTSTSQAIEALQPAIDALREGTSIAIAPEGTTSTTPQLGPVQKGAFHLAMAARVPIVPIVFHNALDALPKHAMVVRSATIDVTVLPPIPTTHWTMEDLDAHIEDVHERFERELDRSI